MCVRLRVRAQPKKFFDQKKFLTKKIFDQKKCFLIKFLFTKNPVKKFLTQKNFFQQILFLHKTFLFYQKNKKKHHLCWNIDITETSTAPASDIPWGPLNIDRVA